MPELTNIKKCMPNWTIRNEYIAFGIEKEIEGLFYEYKMTVDKLLRARNENKKKELRDYADLIKKRAEQQLSQYVFAQMPENLIIRAVKFEISLVFGKIHAFKSDVTKIITAFVSKNPKLYPALGLEDFFKECLAELIQWEYLGWDCDGWAYDGERWRNARRVLEAIYLSKDIAYLETVRSIRDKFVSGEVNAWSNWDDFAHAENIGVLEFVVKSLETVKQATVSKNC